jgi:hypothetical protein
MTYLDRARLLHGKGETVNAANVLAEGLKRDRNNADAMEWFVSLYVNEVPNPGLETDVIAVLAVQDNAANLLSLIESDLISAGAESKLSALRKARSRDPQLSGAAPAVAAPEAAPAPAAAPAAEYWDAFASPLESDQSSPRNTREAATVYADRAAQVPAQFRTISDLSVVDDLPFSPDEDFGQIQRERWIRVAIAFGALVVASLLFYLFVLANPSTPVSGPAAISPTPAGR